MNNNDSITPMQAIEFLEHVPGMPDTNEIARHLCPHVSDAVRRSALSAYGLYRNGERHDGTIAAELLYQPAYHGVVNPYALHIGKDVQDAVQERIRSGFRRKEA